MSDKKTLETKPAQKNAVKFVEGLHYYFDAEGLMILTGYFLTGRGYCCGNGCRHCPYPKRETPELQKKSV